MTDDTAKIIAQAIFETNRKYEQLAIEEAEKKAIEDGKKKGRREVQLKIARKLKGILHPEDIAKATELSLNEVLALY